MNISTTLSTKLNAALADPDPAHLDRWLHAAPRGVSTYVAADRAWGEESWLPLHLAATRGHTGAVATLLTGGAQPDARTRFATPLHARQTALHLAAAAGHAAVVRQLLDAGAEADVRDARGRSPLWEAARGGHDAAMAVLLETGTATEGADAGGRTPLHAALMPAAGRGADGAPDHGAPDHGGATAAVVARLLTAGADPNAACPREPAGYTPLLRAALLGPVDDDPVRQLVQLLKAAGAQPTRLPPPP